MAFSPALSYLDITGSTSAVHSYASLQHLTTPGFGDDDEEQLRVFKNKVELQRPGVEGATAGYTVNEATNEITLAVALIASDRLIILRQTRQDRPYVEFTKGAPLNRVPDMNLAIDQMMFLIQEIQEYSQVAEILDSVVRPDISNKEKYQITITGSTSAVHSYAAITLLPNHSVRHNDQLVLKKNGVLLVLTTDYTVNAATQEITLVVALTAPDTLVITRQTQRTRYVPSLPEGSAVSSDTLLLQINQVKNLVQELPYVLDIDNSSVISGIRNPRRKNFVRYSGPGDRFFYGNLPYLQNSTVFVWRDDTLLTEGVDYTNDDWQWLIDLINSLLAGQVITIMTVPSCPFPEVFFCDWSDLGPLGDNGAPTGPTQPIPTVLVPVTADSTNINATGTTLVCDGAPIIESIRLHWDLTTFLGRSATSVTFGLVKKTGADATDTVKIFEADENWNKVNPATPVLTWDVLTTTQGNWMISPSVLTFVNARLADDGHVRMILEAEGVLDEFTVVSKEGQTGFDFGPHMSLNGAAYPATSAVMITKFAVGFNQSASGADREALVMNSDLTKHFGWACAPAGGDYVAGCFFDATNSRSYITGDRRTLNAVSATTWKFDIDSETDASMFVVWSFDHGVGEAGSDVVYDPVNDLVFVAGTASTTWTGSGGTNANMWALNPASGAVVWNKLISIGGSPAEGAVLALDAQGNLFAALSALHATDPNLFKINPLTGTTAASVNTGIANTGLQVRQTDGQVLVTGGGFTNDVKTYSNSLALATSFSLGSFATNMNGDWIGDDVVVFNIDDLNRVQRYTTSGTPVWGAAFRAGDFCVGTVLTDGDVLITANRNTLWTGAGGAFANSWRLNGTTGALEASADNSFVPAVDALGGHPVDTA